MLQFFRKIRRKLLQEGSFRQYLLYAIGEILLVMVGILLALQVNSWNENRLEGIEEVNLLEGIQKDLAQDTLTYQSALEIQNISLRKQTALRDIIYNRRPRNDSITNYFRSIAATSTPIFVVATYERALRKGLKTISNDSLRNHLVLYYESVIPYMDNKTKIDPKYQFATIMRPFYNKYLKIEFDQNDSKIYSLNDLPAMANDNPFLVELNTALLNKDVIIDLLEDSLEECRSLIEQIEVELEVLR